MDDAWMHAIMDGLHIWGITNSFSVGEDTDEATESVSSVTGVLISRWLNMVTTELEEVCLNTMEVKMNNFFVWMLD